MGGFFKMCLHLLGVLYKHGNLSISPSQWHRSQYETGGWWWGRLLHGNETGYPGLTSNSYLWDELYVILYSPNICLTFQGLASLLILKIKTCCLQTRLIKISFPFLNLSKNFWKGTEFSLGQDSKWLATRLSHMVMLPLYPANWAGHPDRLDKPSTCLISSK